MALRQFAHEGNLKWVSLLMWAGADPRSRGPTIEDADDPEWSTTALHEASEWGNVAVLKRLRPDPSDDLAGMLERAAYRANSGALEHLLALGANPNDKPDGGSSALDACLRILGFEELDRVEHGDVAIYEESPQKPSSGRSAIRVLLRHGAVWTPDVSTLDATRRILYKLEPACSSELLGQLRARENGEPALRELLRVRQLRQYLAFCERRLARLGGARNQSALRADVVRDPSSNLTRDNRWRVFERLVEADCQGRTPIPHACGRTVAGVQGARDPCLPEGTGQEESRLTVPRRPKLPALDGPFR